MERILKFLCIFILYKSNGYSLMKLCYFVKEGYNVFFFFMQGIWLGFVLFFVMVFGWGFRVKFVDVFMVIEIVFRNFLFIFGYIVMIYIFEFII